MNNNLVTTSINETFSESSNNILLGDWCYPYLNKKSNFKIKKLKFHWDSIDKKENDYKYLENLYYKILRALTLSFNLYHSTEKTERYWHIIIGPFLINFLQVFWDRWENIRVAFENEKINETKIINLNYEDCVCSEFLPLFALSNNNQFWNHFIYANIINFLQPKNLKIINIKADSYKASILRKKNKSKSIISSKKFIDLILSKIFKNEKIVFYKSYIEKEKFIKLSLKLKQIPRIYCELDKSIDNIPKLNREKFKLNINPSNKFESFLETILIKVLPCSYLENYAETIEEVRKIKLNPKIIYTAIGHTVDDYFKFWSAEQVMKGTKYIVSDHGGYIDDKQNFGAWSKFSDLYLRWNLDKKKNTLQMPPSILFKDQDFIKSNSNKILLLGNNTQLYPKKVQSATQSGQIIRDVELWENFYNKLDNEKKVFFKFRTHVTDDWNIGNFFSNKYGKNILSKYKRINDDLKTSKIIINTSFSTPFFETIYSGKPTIILSLEKFFSISEEKKQLLIDLTKNKILFDNADNALNHLNKIWDNIDDWWNSKEIVKTKEKFHELCFIKKKNEINFWKDFFLSQLKI